MAELVLSNSIELYLGQISRFPLLSKEEEFELAVRLRKDHDLDAAHKLITSNLRFVVKIAIEYQNYGLRLADLIQEGNIGLMKAVKKFDPYKGYRLITYAVWWIRSHIQAFILKNWSLVSKSVAALKKKLFYQLESSNENINNMEIDADAKFNVQDNASSTSDNQAASSHDYADYRDLSLDRQIFSDHGEEDTTYLDMLPDASANPEDAVLAVQERRIAKINVANAFSILNEKEQYVIRNRFMNEPSLTLEEIGRKLGITRERVRQIEKEAIKKLQQIKKLKMINQN